MEQNPETLLQLLQIKDEITSIVDHNMQSIQLAYENSGINSENIEEILSFVIHEYELKQLSVDNIGKLSLNLFELVMEQMNEKKAIQKNVEEKEEMIRGYEIELREYEQKFDELYKEVNEYRVNLSSAQMQMLEREKEKMELTDQVDEMESISMLSMSRVESRDNEVKGLQERVSQLAYELQKCSIKLKIQNTNIQKMEKQKDIRQLKLFSLEDENKEIKKDILMLKQYNKNLQLQNLKLNDAFSKPSPSTDQVKSNEMSMRSSQRQFLFRVLSTDKLSQKSESKDYVKDEDAQNKQNSNLYKIRSLQRFSSYASLLNMGEGKHTLKNIFSEKEEKEQVSIGINVNLLPQIPQLNSPTKSINSEQTSMDLHSSVILSKRMQKKKQPIEEIDLSQSMYIESKKSIGQFLSEKLVSGRIKTNKMTNSSIQQQKKKEKKSSSFLGTISEALVGNRINKKKQNKSISLVEGNKKSLVGTMMEKVVRRRIKK